MPNPRKRDIGRTGIVTRRQQRYRMNDSHEEDYSSESTSNILLPSVSEDDNNVVEGINSEDSINIPQSMRVVKPNPAAFNYNICDAEMYRKYVQLGNIMVTCRHCQALKWKDETAAWCCGNGNICLPSLPELPALLSDLLKTRDLRSTYFLNNIRKYNTAFAMTSIGCNEVKTRGVFSFSFKICGRLYHRIGSLLPAPATNHQYLQIYFIEDDNEQVDIRMQYERLNDFELMSMLQNMLVEHNVYIKEFKTVYRRIMESEYEISDVRIVLKEKRIPGIHPGRLNMPTVNEIAVVLVGDYTTSRDIVIESMYYYIP